MGLIRMEWLENPAPVGRWFIPLYFHYSQCFVVTNSCQLVQDFFHPQYEPIEDIILPQINSHV
jgi:hypothetical protein